MNSDLEFAVQLVKDTGQLLLEYFNPSGTQTSLKEDFSVVTEADLSADQLITEAIQSTEKICHAVAVVSKSCRVLHTELI